MYASAQLSAAKQLICIDIEAILSQYSWRGLLLSPVISLKKQGLISPCFYLEIWSGRWESNPRYLLGKQKSCH